MKKPSSVLDRLVATLFTKRNAQGAGGVAQRSPRRFTRKLRSAAFPALCLIAALGVGSVYAADYTVGPGGTHETLQDLRNDGTITWTDGDTIKILGDDATLTAGFGFEQNAVTITGSGTISPSGTGFNFGNWGAVVTGTVQADPNETLTFTGFGGGAVNGGVFYGGANGTLNIGSAAGGTLVFLTNNGNSGGAVHGHHRESFGRREHLHEQLGSAERRGDLRRL